MSDVNQTGLPQFAQPLVDARGFVTQAWRQFFLELWRRISSYPGDIKGIAGPTVPQGWLLCDGAAISRSVYANLFLEIGTTWGIGDGSTTFNLPDFRDRFLIGAGGTYVVGDTGGADSTTLTTAQLPSHSHGVSDPTHVHSVALGITPPVEAQAGTGGGFAVSYPQDSAPAATGITIQSTGSGDPVDLLPPYAAVNYIIRT